MQGLFAARLRASEGSHFKAEQEAELKEYRARRVREGAIVPAEEGDEEEQLVASDKLAEIHAQETRVAVPADVLRRRVRAQMPVGDATRVGSAFAIGGAAASGYRPSLGRARWSVPEAPASVLPAAEETAAVLAQRAVAQQALAAGTRALLYGSAALAVAAVVGARLAASAYGIESEEDLRVLAAASAGPMASRMRARLAPARHWCADRLSGLALAPSTGENGFAARLRSTGPFRGLRPSAGE